MKRAITITVGFVVDSNIMTDQQWQELETKLNGRELEVSDLSEALGLTQSDLNNQQTHVEVEVMAC